MPKTPKWNEQWHPFAKLFPMLGEQELRDMAASIQETGQLHPCVMNSDGLGLDGRNRVAACRIAGVEPAWTVNDGNPMSIIIAANVHHRFLTTGQRAMAVAVDLAAKKKRENGRWKRGSVPEAPDSNGSVINGWAQRMKECGVIIDYLPDLADAVLAGEPLDGAFQKAKIEKDRREGEAEVVRERRERTKVLPSDLAALVDNGVRDLDDAEVEARARKVVAEIDTMRNADGAPPPTFADRVQDGTLAWPEAQTLAEGWKQERRESVARDQERLIKLTDGWGAFRHIARDPQHPYAVDVLEGLGKSRREAVTEIIEVVKGGLA